jgi:magnesium transporter
VIEIRRFAPGSTAPESGALVDVAATVTRGDHRDDQGGDQGDRRVVWIDVSDPSAAEITQLDDMLHFGEFLREDLLEGRGDAGQATKLFAYQDFFHVAVRDCTLSERRLVEREIDLVFGAGWLCSVRHAVDAQHEPEPDPFPLDEVLRRFQAQQAHEHNAEEGYLLWAFLDVVSDRYFAITETIDSRIDGAEESLLEDEQGATFTTDVSATQLFRISRPLTQLRHQVVPLREVVGALLRREDPMLATQALLHLRDVHDHLLGITEVIESQRDTVAGLREVQLTIVSNRMNDSMRKLAAWGAILIVATLVTGVLGMNFRDAPNLHWRDGFLLVVGIMAVVGVPMYLSFKKQHWL